MTGTQIGARRPAPETSLKNGSGATRIVRQQLVEHDHRELSENRSQLDSGTAPAFASSTARTTTTRSARATSSRTAATGIEMDNSSGNRFRQLDPRQREQGHPPQPDREQRRRRGGAERRRRRLPRTSQER
jgi:hypothetical protein